MGRKHQVKEIPEELKKPLTREDLLSSIQRVLDIAHDKLDNRYTKVSDKIKWARIITGAVSAGASVLKDAELEQLAQRIEELREDLHLSERLKALEEKVKNDG